jgi:putative ABC transport system permease protein
MNLRSHSWRELRRRPGRSLLTLLGIVIGVAAVVAVSLATATARDAFRSMFDQVGGSAELEVVLATQSAFDPAAIASVATIDGVDATVPLIQTQAALLAGDNRSAVLVLGVDPALDGLVRTYETRDGGPLDLRSWGASADPTARAVPVLLEASYADSQGLAGGDTAQMLTPSGLVDAEVGPLLDSAGLASFNGGAVVLLPLEQAQGLFRIDGVNSVQLVLEDGADVAAVEERVAAALPEGFVVQAPASRGDMAQDTLVATESGLSAVSGLSLVAGAFIILNAFLMSVGERRPQIALLRALGATRRQVTRMLLGEALILGVAGTVLGIGVGAAVSVALTRGLSGLVGADVPGVAFSWTPFVVGGLLGPVLAVAATYVPARRAGRITPLEGLTDGVHESSATARRWPSYLGLGLVAVSTALAVALVAGSVPLSVATPIFMALLVGCVLVVPMVTGPLSRMWAALLVPVLHTEGKLAFRQLARHRTRTSLTVGVLFVAVVVAVSMGGSLLGNVRDSAQWYERTIVGDYFVRGVIPDTGTSRAAAIEPRIGGMIEELDGVETVVPFVFIQSRALDRQVVVMARTFDSIPIPLDLEEGRQEDVLAGLNAGEVVVGTALAALADLGIGDQLVVETGNGPESFTIAGLVTEYTAGGYSLYMDYETAQRNFELTGADLYIVIAREGQADVVGTRLEALSEEEGLLLQSQADFRTMVDGMINGVIGFLWLLIAMVFVVASLGVVNTLTMNVFEQTREIGLLRAVAMTRRQLRKMILSQALAMSAISLVPGLLVGIAVQYLLNRGTLAVSAVEVDFNVEPLVLVGTFVAAIAVSLLAAYFPARRAARFQVIQALQYE